MNKTRTNGFRPISIGQKLRSKNYFYDKFIAKYEQKAKKTFNINNLHHNYQYDSNNLPFIKSKDNNIISNTNYNNMHPVYREVFSLNNNYILKTNRPLFTQKEGRSILTSQGYKEGSLNSLSDSIDKLSKYSIGKEIGKGAYAIVKLVTDKFTKIKYAMKVYDRNKLTDPAKKKCVYREIEIMKRVNHRNIVKLKEVIYTQKEILIIMELVNGISLRDYYNKQIRNQENLSEQKERVLKHFFTQIFSAMSYLHKNHMAHRDIKLENILLDKNNQIKIIDFGFGMYNPEDKIQTFFCGTPNYMPPEIINKKSYIGEKADLWSLGVLLYKMLCADFPFKGENEKELYKMSKKGKFDIPDYVPNKARVILVKLINVIPEMRINCDDVLKYDWFQ